MTDILWNAGTGNNGLITSLLTLMSTELNALASGSYATSSVGGTSGVFTNANTGRAIRGHLQWTWGGAITPASPLAIPVWFLKSLDGTNFEPASALNARAPDAVLSFAASANSLGSVFQTQGPSIEIPAVNFRVGVLNNVGGALPSTGNLLKLGLVAPAF